MYNQIFSKVFLGCCASTFLMEILMSYAPQTALFITFLQFLFTSLEGFIFTAKFGKVKSKIPFHQYVVLVALFFVSSVSNNYVYVLHVPSTLHMIIRSASSPASMLVSWWCKKRRPRLNNAVGSILITIGVTTAMYGGSTVAEQNEGHLISWCIGVAILLSMLFIGAFTGLQQEILFMKYGKHSEEMMFYTHVIPLPFFLTLYPQMRDSASTLNWEIWCIIVVQIVSQYYCTSAVHKLATKETSVTVTFILTLRRFLSLLISSVVFNNNLTVFHIIGTALVIIGTYIYFDYFSSRKQRSVSLKDS